MAIQTRALLKEYFKTGAYPTQQQFYDLIDSYLHKNDTGIAISNIDGLADILNRKADDKEIRSLIDRMIGDVSTAFESGEELNSVNIINNINDSTKMVDGNVLGATIGKNIATLWDKEFPTVMSVANNSSTLSLDKMNIVVTNTGDNSHPEMSLTGTVTYTPYQGAVTTTNIAAADIVMSGVYATFEQAVAYGKKVYSFTDSNSGKTGSIIFRHAKTCYMWLTADAETVINANAYTFTPTSCVGSSNISKSMTANLATDSYVYVAVPKTWIVTQITVHSNIADVHIAMSLVNASDTDAEYNIYCSSEKVLNVNGNTIYVSGGSGSIA